ncbi:TATA box-binding protein-associated factor RNA polymerase I subunit B [Desmophyllum pertusum]|uniref:TATA box-binding protein-associated factor RNA polymerase I subunit B n=1 Tax=Desmophyllum pertusum TaxID=174260 RepID=A0A9X0D3W5_9CNID|nr:TATA box-binding protein-associated factor RNA polymerase I subunit B [Desmophyllum pertusum]
MPVCELCEAESFDLIDGLYYCQSCGTQSQDIRDEMVADEDLAVDGHLQLKQRGKCGRKRQFFPDKGKPWFLYEAFQHIIKVQVEYLIKLGVDPALKDVVFKLWYKYLQQTGNAFTGSTTGTVPNKGSIFYTRHADLLDVNKRKKRGGNRRWILSLAI